MAENNDGYVLHAAEGARTIVEIDESTSTFKTVDGKLTGTLEGTIAKEFTGNSNKFSVNLNNIPFDGAGGGSGGGSGVETLVVTGEVGGDPTNPGFTVTNTSMTFDELNDAILDGKPVLCFLNVAMSGGGSQGFNRFEPIILSHVIGPIAPDDQTPALFEIHGVSVATYRRIGSADEGYKTIISYIELSWDRGDELPTVEIETYTVAEA